MPVDLVITDLCVQLVVRDAIDLGEVKEAYERAWSHPDFRVGMSYYVDVRHGTIARFEIGDPSRIASFIRIRLDQHGQVKTALLCERPVDIRIARMFEAYAGITADLPVRVCRSEEEALAWLRGEIEYSEQLSVTEQERTLRLSEERIQMVLEGSEQGFWDWNIETGEVQRNDRWAQMRGYTTLGEFENTTDSWTDSIHPDDRDAAWKSINDHLEGRTSAHTAEYRMITKDGGYKWILDHAKIVQRDASGRPLRMSGTHTDISDRKQMEEEREKLIKSLQETLNEVKILRGIIPICSYCHCIRNDEGAWDQMESYISKHSEVRFSHGICPKCHVKVLADVGLGEK